MMAAEPGNAPPAQGPAPWRERGGLLALDKAAGPTSHDVVMRVRRRLGAPGAGHLGTLDPGATGLLLVAIGAATRCIPEWQGGEKTYEATIRLGVTTTTQDLAGEVLESRAADVSESQVRAASIAFVGDGEQVPPMVSALKHRGERLHAIARRGESVERAPRPICVTEWEWLEFALPEARFRVRCSGGTYVRTLAHDLGTRLGCGAALASLRRLRSEPFGIDRSVSSAALDQDDPEAVWAAGGIGLDEALGHLPWASLTEAEAVDAGHGRAIRIASERLSRAATGTRVVLRDTAGGALGLAEPLPAEGVSAALELHPRVVFPWAVR